MRRRPSGRRGGLVLASVVLAFVAASCTVSNNGSRPTPPPITTSPHAGVSQPTLSPAQGFLETGTFNACSTEAGEATIQLTTAPAIPVQLAFSINVFTPNPTTVHGVLTDTTGTFVSPWMPASTCFGVFLSAFDANFQPSFTYTGSW